MTSIETDLSEEQEVLAATMTGIKFNVSGDEDNVSILHCCFYLFVYLYVGIANKKIELSDLIEPIHTCCTINFKEGESDFFVIIFELNLYSYSAMIFYIFSSHCFLLFSVFKIVSDMAT